MRRPLLRFMAFAAILTLSAAWPIAAASSTYAASGLGVTGSLLDVIMPSGTTYVHSMTVTDGFDYALDMQVEARGLGQGLDGSYIPLTSGEDHSPYSALGYIAHIDIPSFHLEPGDSQVVNATLNAPSDAAPGTRYACIYIFSQATGGGQVGIAVAAIVPIVVNVPGSEQTQTGQITALNVSQLKSGQPIEISTTFANSGNYYYKAENQVVIRNEAGEVVADNSTDLTSSSIIPTFSRLFAVDLVPTDPAKGMPAGQYSVESRVMLEDGTLLASTTTGLTVPPGYKPPTPETGKPSNINWLLIVIAVLVALVVIPIVVYFLVTRMRKYKHPNY